MGACQCRTHMCHYMSSKSSSDSSPSPSSSTVSSVSWMRDQATMLRGLCVRRATVGTFSRRKSCLAHTEHTLSSRAVTATCARMHTRVNAYAYTSECGCALKHQNALQCVRMHVLHYATCRQIAPYMYVGRRTNAFKCNSCRMQLIENAQ